jgi:hypothetical protein
MKLGDLFIKLGLKSEQFEQGINKAKGAMSGFSTLAKTIGTTLVAAFSVNAIMNFAQKIIATANEIIQLENSLAAAIRSTGKDVDSTMRQYKRFADEMERMTLVDAEVTMGMLRMAEAMRSKAPMEAARNAIALSKALGVDLNMALKMATMAQGNIYSMLSRYSVEIRKATSDTQKAAEYQKLLASGMQVAGTEVESAAGKAKLAQNAWEGLWEAIAIGILQTEGLIQTLTDLETAITMLSTKKFGITSFLAFLSGGKSWEADKKRFEEMIKMQKSVNDANDRMAKHTAELDAQTKKQVEQVKTYNDLNEELKELLELKGNLSENDKAGITVINQEIEALKNKIKALDELGIAIEKVARAENRSVGAIAPGQQFSGQFTARKGQYGRSENVWMQDLAPLQTGALEFEKLNQSIEYNKNRAAQMLSEIPEDWQRFNEQLGSLIQDFGTDVVDQFGQAMGELLATGEIDGDFGLRLLESIGRFVSTLGSMLIALGVGSESFKQLLGSGFLSGGVGAIAAGALLVAAGGAISGYARSRARGGSGGAGGGSGMFNQNYNIQQANASGSQATLFLKGDNIYMSQQRNAFKRGVIG